jgi:CHASE2 domain-containing sensor protein
MKSSRPNPMKQPAVEIFISYAHEDEALRNELAKHLKLLERQGVIKAWHDRNITAGEEWRSAIDSHLESAKIILLLISADFLASDYCYDIELKRALERHESKEARVIPVILRSVDWGGSALGELTALPTDGQAIDSWQNRDKAFKDVVQGVRRAINSLANQDHEPTPAISGNIDPADRPIMPLWRTGLLVSLGATAAISVLRFTGALQPLELGAYDYTMRSRYLAEGQDDNILVVKVIAEDEPDRGNRSNTLSDERLDQLLALLKEHEPSVIGFDNFLNHKIDPKYQNIQEGLQSGSLVTVCQATENDPLSFKAPEGATSIGFGDITIDHDAIVRRHLLQMKIQTPACNQAYALSTVLANYYLDDKNQKMALPFRGEYGQIGNKKLGFLSNYIGGYQQFAPINKNDNWGYQIMLNYRRAHSLLDGFSSISINEIFKLSSSELTARIKDRIILIGTTEAAVHKDMHKTPYGETIPGVFLQAQMTSQLVNAALHNRPFIWAYPFMGEVLMIWLSAGVGWLVFVRVRSRWVLVGLNGLVILLFSIGSVCLLTVAGYWFPLVPTGLGFVLGCSSVTIYQFIGTKLKGLSSSF